MLQTGERLTISVLKAKRIMAICVALGVLMATLDGSIVNMALPTMAKQLQTNLPNTQWVVLAYMLGVACFLLPMGSFADRWGRRVFYGGGFLLFTLASVGCGLSQSVEMLFVMRFIQAIGGAAIMANGPAIISELFPDKRSLVFGYIGGVVSLGTICGPSLGGVILSSWGWPWIFLVNVPIGLLAVVLAWIALAVLSQTRGSILGEKQGLDDLDWWGMGLSSGALLALTLLLTYGLSQPWGSGFNMAMGSCFLLLLCGFVQVERQVKCPVLPFDLFRVRLFANCCVASLFSFFGITALFFLIPFFWDVVQHRDLTQSGLMLMSCPLALAVFSAISGRFSERWGTVYFRALGMAISAFGLWQMSRWTPETTGFEAVVMMILVGMGNGLFHPPNNSDMFGAVNQSGVLGTVGGIQAIVRTLGMMLSIALVGAVFKLSGASFLESSGFMMAFTVLFKTLALITLGSVVWILKWR